MSAAALHLTTMVPDHPLKLDPKKWIPVTEAADKLRMHRGHLSRRCQTELEAKGLAVMATPQDGGKATWHILRTWHQVLTPGRVGELFQVPTLEEYSEEQRLGAHQRVECIEAYRHARQTAKGDQKDWIHDLCDNLQRKYPKLSISRSTVLRWHSVYRTPRDIEKLVDTRGGNRRGEASPAAWKYFKDLFLDENEPSKIDIWRATRDEARRRDWRWLTYRKCCEQLPDKIPPDIQAQFRQPKAWRRQCAAYVPQDPERWAAGECWEGDHRQLNVICQVGMHRKLIRPWLTAWIDRRSRRLVGWVLSEQPNSTTILAALRAGLKDQINHGGPTMIWIDNGKDYDSFTLHGQTKSQRKSKIHIAVDETMTNGVLNRRAIEAHFSIPRNPNGKRHMERWFDTLEPFDKRYRTYCARNTESKPEGLANALKERHKVPTLEQLRQALADHIDGYNKATGMDRDSYWMDIQLDGLSPDDFMLEHCPNVRRMPRDEDLDLLMQKHCKPVRVRREGIPVRINGKTRYFGMHDPAIIPLKGGVRDEHGFKAKGLEVNVTYDPADITKVYAWTLDWKIIGCFDENGRGGHVGDPIHEEQDKAIIRKTQKVKKASKFARENYLHEIMTNEQLINIEKQRDEKAIRDQIDSKPLKMVQTPFDSPSKELQKQQARKAAGAEDFNEEDRFDLMAELANAQRHRDDDDLEPLQFKQPDADSDELITDVLDLTSNDDDDDETNFSIDLALNDSDAQDDDDQTIDLSLISSATCADDDDSADIDMDVLCLDDGPEADMEDDADGHNILDLIHE